MPRALSLVLTLFSGWLYGLCFPTASLQLLAWVALVPFLAVLRRTGVGRALLLSWVWTLMAAYTVGDWFAHSVATYYQQPILIGVGFFIGVSSFMAAPFYMAFALAYRLLVRRPGPALPLLVAAAWSGTELARGRLLGANPWALFGYSQVGLDHLVQLADVTSVYGVSFLLVAVNAAAAEVLARGRRAGLGLVTALASVALALGYGDLCLRDATSPAVSGAIETVMVQANLDLGSQWREEFYGRNLDAHLRLTREALRNARPDLIFWPEGALTFFLEEEPLYRGAIGRVLAASGAQLIVGGPRNVRTPEPVFYNSIFLLSAAGEILGTYDKERLVPFAERFPFGSIELLRRRFARVREFSPGILTRPLVTAVGAAGVTVCNEAMFPELVAARVRDGARFLVDPANDTWLTPKFSAQQFDIVRLRTVEQRRYLVRASTSGPSAIVDPWGRVAVRTQFFTSATVAGRIEAREEITAYGRIGDLFGIGCLLVAVGASVTRARPRHG